MEHKQIIANLMTLCKEMGNVIRTHDEDCYHIEFWRNDGANGEPDYVPDERYLAAEQFLLACGAGPL